MQIIAKVYAWALAALFIAVTAVLVFVSTVVPAHAECGKASWYRSGRLTAEGRPFLPGKVSVAHKTLPFGTMIRIVDQKTGNRIVARVSDRGPYKRGRIVDVSLAAAELLQMRHRGVISVCISIVSRGARPPGRFIVD